MNINQVYELFISICSKNLEQGYVSPENFNDWINQGERSYLDYLLGEYQKYQIKRPIAVVEFGQNQRIRTSIAPLIYEEILNVNNITGITSFPYAFEQVDAMWGQYGFYNIRFTEQDRLSGWYRSVVDPVQTNPVYLIKHEGFQFYPETIGNVRLSYVRTPSMMTWAYTIDSNGLPVYDPINSSQPVWSEIDLMQIIVRGLSIAGVNLQMPVVMQYAEQIKQGGQ